MSGIFVLMQLVRCSHSLLICEDIDTAHLRFRDAADCNHMLPAMIAQHTNLESEYPVVMGRCRFIAIQPKKDVPTAKTTEG